MTISINGIEALWIGINGATLLLTVIAAIDAWTDLRVARAGSDRRRARVLTAVGNFRREVIRTVVQVLLLGVAVPGAFIDREISLTPPLAFLMAVPMLLLAATLLDRADRNKLGELVLHDIITDREAVALEASVQENIELTREVGQKADAAYNEANHANDKLNRLTEIVGHKEDKPGEGTA